MTSSHKILKVVRQIHLYIGIFISPAILFFAFTGALQTFSLHETTRGSDYKPPTWIATLAQLHKKQTTTVPIRKPRPADVVPKPDKHADASAPQPSPEPPQKSHLPMKIFFLLVAIGLFTSTLTGIYMSYKFMRNRLVVTVLLIAGTIIPLLLLPF
ncbi:PepSY domain-containing protein [Granulicella sp. L46]|jgi:hypothetical protein|uniref:PepSY domain-containing protein n=1 Tax=Granulicella sp. L46 TaxID=1641865 RepID=UPI00131B05E8|nr:PepSY domain-containing protein [Granulicella sp. L46]